MNEGRQSIEERRKIILKIIDEEPVSTQAELMSRLLMRGVNITQATVSRDIRELKLVKTTDDEGRSVYAVPGREKPRAAQGRFQFFGNTVKSVASAGNMVVIRTDVGMAQAVCAGLDKMQWRGILGTIAGDDTVFAVAADEKLAEAMVRDLGALWQV